MPCSCPRDSDPLGLPYVAGGTLLMDRYHGRELGAFVHKGPKIVYPKALQIKGSGQASSHGTHMKARAQHVKCSFKPMQAKHKVFEMAKADAAEGDLRGQCGRDTPWAGPGWVSGE